MAKKVTLSTKEYDKLISKFGSLLSQIEKELQKTHMHFAALMRGDADGPYWNGGSAIKFYKLAKTNYSKNTEAYNALLLVYNKLVQLRDDLRHQGLIVPSIPTYITPGPEDRTRPTPPADIQRPQTGVQQYVTQETEQPEFTHGPEGPTHGPEETTHGPEGTSHPPYTPKTIYARTEDGTIAVSN